jgi:hypothetical protein
MKVVIRAFCVAVVCLAAGSALAAGPQFGPAQISFGGQPAPAPSSSVAGFWLVAGADGPQVALMPSAGRAVTALRRGETIEVMVAAAELRGPCKLSACVTVVQGERAEVTLSLGDAATSRTIASGETTRLEIAGNAVGQTPLRLKATTSAAQAGVRWDGVSLSVNGPTSLVLLAPAGSEDAPLPAPVLPNLQPAIEDALIEWDWRMQDGIGTPRAASHFLEAIKQTFRHGDALLADLQRSGVPLGNRPARWAELKQRFEKVSADPLAFEGWEELWRSVHRLRREIALTNPLSQVGPLLFVKQVPGQFSHQLTQYYGRYARPGGGVFVLDEPGRSMRARQLAAGALPQGSYQHPEVSYDGRRVLFSYCKAETPPTGGTAGQHGRYYHLCEMAADGSGLRQLTDGAFDDFAPRYLPDGRIVFISTRRLGWHRCGSPGCENYTLTTCEADGSNPQTISRHETQEWDPAVLADGRIVYTRWDYVDRHAVYYEQLWTTRPDGTSPAAFYGNNTFNPVGVWEPQQVPGSRRVMATAAPHHGMTAGSIILVDVTRGNEGLAPITRLTPDALFPESECVLLPGWHATAGLHGPVPQPVEAARWPGHCYRSPWPLSENYFLAAYSFDPLVGEPRANRPNMFGIYLVDGFGNKELLYRDPNIASLWPSPLRARTKPPALPSVPSDAEVRQATVFVQNVYAAAPPLEAGSVKRLRVVQVLPKSTPCANSPTVGIPNASPGKQVLGTVPVEADGSALFRVPAGVPLSFQVLDDRGQAVQVMRSVTYFRPGEQASCVGCHEPRMIAPQPKPLAQALARPASAIQPAPEGACPLSYPILVQPVLDRKCVSCHNPQKPDGRVVLTGEPQGAYTVSYNALAPRVSYSAWGKGGDFRQTNSEPLSTPGFFGARGSPLMKMLLAGHEKVQLTPEEIDRLVTWMDANALFYGTFDREDQARQQRGEKIAGPKLE